MNPVEHPNATHYAISVNQRSGTYFARILKTGLVSSCTRGEEAAAQAVTRKFLGNGAHQLIRVAPDFWALTDLRYVPASSGGAK